jgi:hypothetical protein
MNNLAIDVTPRLSNASKMPCKSFSTRAGDTCAGQRMPGSTEVDPVCQDCYAKKGRYEMDNVVALRVHNELAWKSPAFEEDMIALIGRRPLFRWFDSGDIVSPAMARKIYNIMKATPGTRHWLPTRMGRFTKYKRILAAMARLDNVVVRHSAWGYDNLPPRGVKNGSMVYRDRPAPAGTHPCPAYATPAGTCRKANCFACWNSSVKTIAYPGH